MWKFPPGPPIKDDYTVPAGDDFLFPTHGMTHAEARMLLAILKPLLRSGLDAHRFRPEEIVAMTGAFEELKKAAE